MMSVTQIIISAIAIIFTLVTHEFAHAYIALLNGDNTAKSQNRLTLNPLKHLDPLGTLCMVLFRFGWAKPVPINPNNFKNYRFGMFSVSIAGIIINLITAFLSIILNIFIDHEIINLLLNMVTSYGIIFAVFNFIPIPPLDGSKILASILPFSFTKFIYKYEKYSSLILIGLLYLGIIDKILMPTVNYIYKFMILIISAMGII